jgi:hypothetical protein
MSPRDGSNGSEAFLKVSGTFHEVGNRLPRRLFNPTSPLIFKSNKSTKHFHLPTHHQQPRTQIDPSHQSTISSLTFRPFTDATVAKIDNNGSQQK